MLMTLPRRLLRSTALFLYTLVAKNQFFVNYSKVIV
ncbi:hypothetical protein SPAB_00270 [Salmonella enterica subsp. enterica serovar Paratyphi B str. SPB7]|uniref:Uncharacterized protein n=1 Tax=Salmonella paratyphi B (strain ATCC BAA-1250 / SPB7) TaxID=1016998 RepID=A0A6C6YX49_SALPB|nr:hypothetical protein SPAB_00270 [Salmonella enterica subsp. enterica serovar Paratyphi B str. SPB7]